MASILRVEGVSKRFGGLAALDNVSLEAHPKQVTSIIGQNGAGKTTLLNAIVQLNPPDTGRVLAGSVELTGLPPHQVLSRGVARTFQQLRLFSRLTVLENVLACMPGNPGERIANLILHPRSARAEQRRFAERARSILSELDLLTFADQEAGRLSYGLQKMLSLARLAATDADILMLDEPTSGLSADFVAKVTAVVRRWREAGKTIVLVEHDMDVVFDVSDHIIVLDQGKLFAQGVPAAIRADQRVRAIYFGSRVA
jgi:ABC-type branched-subunit amino acid transport system ATPase component